MTDQVRKILDCYRSENPGVLTNLARILNHGRLGGTGRMIILPVDQGSSMVQRAVLGQILPLTIRPR
jgi:DhnA family fructose-bisphosphate aldolase class Ia